MQANNKRNFFKRIFFRSSVLIKTVISKGKYKDCVKQTKQCCVAVLQGCHIEQTFFILLQRHELSNLRWIYGKTFPFRDK